MFSLEVLIALCELLIGRLDLAIEANDVLEGVDELVLLLVVCG